MDEKGTYLAENGVVVLVDRGSGVLSWWSLAVEMVAHFVIGFELRWQRRRQRWWWREQAWDWKI